MCRWKPDRNHRAKRRRTAIRQWKTQYAFDERNVRLRAEIKVRHLRFYNRYLDIDMPYLLDSTTSIADGRELSMMLAYFVIVH